MLLRILKLNCKAPNYDSLDMPDSRVTGVGKPFGYYISSGCGGNLSRLRNLS